MGWEAKSSRMLSSTEKSFKEEEPLEFSADPLTCQEMRFSYGMGACWPILSKPAWQLTVCWQGAQEGTRVQVPCSARPWPS